MVYICKLLIISYYLVLYMQSPYHSILSSALYANSLTLTRVRAVEAAAIFGRVLEHCKQVRSLAYRALRGVRTYYGIAYKALHTYYGIAYRRLHTVIWNICRVSVIIYCFIRIVLDH